MHKGIRNLLWTGLLITAALLAGCGKITGGGSGMAADSLEARVDKHCEEIMASGKKAEAREWMKSPSHIFFKEDPKQVAGFVEEFYNAGATQVFIVDTEEHDGKEFAGGMMLVLPKDPAVRAKLFAVGAKVEVAVQDDPVTDKGQKYLLYTFD